MDAPAGHRWCRECLQFLTDENFKYPTALCHPHWLQHNRAKSRARAAANPGYDAERNRKWRAKNPDKVKERNLENAKLQKAKGYPAVKAWREANQERVRRYDNAYGKKWREENPEKFAAQRHRKRARKAAAPGQHNYKELLALTERFNGQCIYCPRPGHHMGPHCPVLARRV
jgi:hypothetical protein